MITVKVKTNMTGIMSIRNLTLTVLPYVILKSFSGEWLFYTLVFTPMCKTTPREGYNLLPRQHHHKREM